MARFVVGRIPQQISWQSCCIGFSEAFALYREPRSSPVRGAAGAARLFASTLWLGPCAFVQGVATRAVRLLLLSLERYLDDEQTGLP